MLTKPGSTIQTFHSDHVLYRTGDANAPSSIKDGNGDVALGLCRKCGRGERELEEPCVPRLGSTWVDDSNPQAALAEVIADDNQPSIASRIASVPCPHDNNNPLWKGPCGEGPLGGITQSMFVRFLSCRERFRLKYVLGLEPHDKWNHRIGYGNMWHACEEVLARDGRSGCWVEHLVDHRNAMIRQYPLQCEEITKWWNVCHVQFPEYVRYWAEHSDVKNRTPLFQEQIFDVPYTLHSGRVVRLRGKWDSVDLIDGGIYLQENKTKSDIDKLQIERQLKFDLQTMLYLVALRESDHVFTWRDSINNSGGNISSTEVIKGVRYNVVRRPLSGGVGSIKPHAAKATKTKVTPAETAEQFYERLRRDYLAADPGHWFFRVRSEICARDIQVFRKTCLDPLLETVCCWYDSLTLPKDEIIDHSMVFGLRAAGSMNYRTPFGVYSALEENGSTEYDAYLETGSDATLRRIDTLFPEL